MITRFEDCDFIPMFNYFEAEKAKRKAMTAAEKKAVKAEKEALEEPFKTCLLDGRKEKIGNFRIEPPGLFRGRGDHPKKGALKVSTMVYYLVQVGADDDGSCASHPRISQSILAKAFLFPNQTCLASGKRLFTMTL
jgi:Eukaryotic DNA topoisomerase I, DNA binding fragment